MAALAPNITGAKLSAEELSRLQRAALLIALTSVVAFFVAFNSVRLLRYDGK